MKRKLYSTVLIIALMLSISACKKTDNTTNTKKSVSTETITKIEKVTNAKGEVETTTKVITEKVTESNGEIVTTANGEAVTKTEIKVEEVTKLVTEVVSKDNNTAKATTKAPSSTNTSEKTSEKNTEPVTEKVTEPVTEPATEKPTEPATEAPTEPQTQPPTEPEPIIPPTEPETPAPTEPETEARKEIKYISVDDNMEREDGWPKPLYDYAHGLITEEELINAFKNATWSFKVKYTDGSAEYPVSRTIYWDTIQVVRKDGDEWLEYKNANGTFWEYDQWGSQFKPGSTYLTYKEFTDHIVAQYSVYFEYNPYE